MRPWEGQCSESLTDQPWTPQLQRIANRSELVCSLRVGCGAVVGPHSKALYVSARCAEWHTPKQHGHSAPHATDRPMHGTML